MQTFPPLCIYNFGLPRRTLSPAPPPTPRDFSTSVRPPCRAHPPSSCGACPPSHQLPCAPDTDANDDDDERRTRPGLGGDWREDLGWAATGGDLAWAATGTHDVRQNGAKKKKARARSVKKNSGWGPDFGFAKSKCKVPWSWTIFRLCK